MAARRCFRLEERMAVATVDLVGSLEMMWQRMESGKLLCEF